jgi:hypothetical protein
MNATQAKTPLQGSTALFAAWLLLATAGSGLAATHYVDLNSPNPTPPYTNWATAASMIQNAVDAAAAGDEVLVTNGVYVTGGRAVGTEQLTNRVVLDKPLTLQSVNGPQFTTLDGQGTARCAHLSASAIVSGFTLTNGIASAGAGVWCESVSNVVSNCLLVGNHCYDGDGGGAYQGTVTNCILADNEAFYGAGAYGARLVGCILSNNLADNSWYYSTTYGYGGLGGGANSSTLTDCTLSGNAATVGGGAYECTLNHCTVTGNSAGDYYYGSGLDGVSGGGAASSALTDCVLSGNAASYGGGAYLSSLTNCTLSGNGVSYYYDINYGYFGGYGGGTYGSIVNNCSLSNNAAQGDGYGGGDYGSVVQNCVITANTAVLGGGAAEDYLDRCTLTVNSAIQGGGAFESTLRSCALSGNLAARITADYFGYPFDPTGGGAAGCVLTNCTITGNLVQSFVGSGGGASGCVLYNCISYFNTAAIGANYDGCSLTYCCATPLPTNGVGNISGDPGLASASRLSAVSPCRGAGNAAIATGTDIDGEVWATPPSIGCDEYYEGGLTGQLSAQIFATFTNVAVGFPVSFAAVIDGRPFISVWEFGDGSVEIDEPYTMHQWAAPGDYLVALWVFNDSYPNGVSATVVVHVVAQEAIYYVASQNSQPAPPYTSWASAATNIQDAVDAAAAGATILVTNGIYASGGRAVLDGMANRVTVDKPLAVRSVNGPQFTFIQGYAGQPPTNGTGTLRCVYLTNGASLSGFTLNGGAADYGGGIWCASPSVVVTNCVVSGNSALEGGGIYGGCLNNCTLSGNVAGSGGAVYYAALSNCALTGNSARQGGGAFASFLSACVLTGNSASFSGGGAQQSSLYSCALNANSAGWAGGVFSCILNNCTLTANQALTTAGGAHGSTLNNCIVYFNTALRAANYDEGCALQFCCTTPLPSKGIGNTASDPLLAAPWYLSALSPCRGAGSAEYARGTDIDGEAWANPPSIGSDEYHTGSITGALSLGLTATYTNVAIRFSDGLTALIQGRPSWSRWDFGDGTSSTNEPFTAHAWSGPGDYAVVLTAYNDSLPAGVAATLTIHVVDESYYVSATNTNPLPPFTSWATAATNIQDAVDAAVAGGTVVVTNGTYATGGRTVSGTLTNRVAVDKPLRLCSVNGPDVTVIQGHQVPGTGYGAGAVRCVYLANGASLLGFTVFGGATQSPQGGGSQEVGGGVFCEGLSTVISNCWITGNWAAAAGGGCWQGTLCNCTLSANSADAAGGGASGSTMTNCTLSRNSSYSGGGTASSTLDGCVLTGNSGSDGGGDYNGTLYNCVLSGNSAIGDGGGAFDSTLHSCVLATNLSMGDGGGARASLLANCALIGNSAAHGGGAANSSLNNCTLAANVASDSGGGVSQCTLKNCIISANSSIIGANYAYSELNYCCTLPMPTNGVGNITNGPLWMDINDGDLRLQASSPCINAGNNAYAVPGPDLDGNPRISGGTVDIGAYEFQNPASVISYAWLQQYGLPTDGSADFADPDHDGMNNWQEWRCGTDPTNPFSALRLLSAFHAGTNATVTWQSVAGMSYFLERSTNLATPGTFTTIATTISGQPGTTSYTDTNAVGTGPFFYRVGVGN